MMASRADSGMEDVIACQSAITWIDGETGQLRYRGYAIGELAERTSYEETAYLIWNAELPTKQQLVDLKERLRSERMERTDLIDLVQQVPLTAHPLDALRYAVSWDSLRNELTWNNSDEANREKSIAFTAWFPMVVCAYHRLRKGEKPVEPRPDLDSAANFLYMLHGSEADEVAVRTLDTSLVLHAEHELNASTFAARVTIATQSNLHAAIASALGTLAGPRHGGASEHVIRMLEEIGRPDRTEDYVQDQLRQHKRIMGFGHRVYRTIDPRSRHLRVMAEKMLAGTEHESWIEILERIRVIMERERHLYPNVDLYAALVNHELGIDPAFYTSVFACSRIAGWTAHAIEQLEGRLIRPAAEYVGPGPRSLAAPAAV